MEDSPAYWTIRIGEAESKEAFEERRAIEIFHSLCDRLPNQRIELCEVWIKPIKVQEARSDVG